MSMSKLEIAERQPRAPAVPAAQSDWLRALEMTAPIGAHPTRILPVVIEELAAKFGDAPALISERECFSHPRSSPSA